MAGGVHEGFTLRDLIKPDAARLQRNLSAIINFQKFREEKIEQWAGHGRKTVRAAAEMPRGAAHCASTSCAAGRSSLLSVASTHSAAFSSFRSLQVELEHLKATLEAERRELETQLQREKCVVVNATAALLLLYTLPYSTTVYCCTCGHRCKQRASARLRFTRRCLARFLLLRGGRV